MLLDASIVDTPHKPNGRITIEVADDREDTRSYEAKQAEEEYQKLVVRQRKGTDEEARWVKKGVYRFGYKKHVMTNVQGIVQKVITTPANRSDTKELIPLLEGEEIPEEAPVFANKGYASQENREYLESRSLQDGIMQKAYRNRPLTEQQKAFNKAISPIRSAIERTFGSIRRWFNGGDVATEGLQKLTPKTYLNPLPSTSIELQG